MLPSFVLDVKQLLEKKIISKTMAANMMMPHDKHILFYFPLVYKCDLWN